MAERKTAKPDLLQAAFEVIGEQGWSRASAQAIAARAGVSLVEVYRQLPGRLALLRALSERIDEAMLEVDQAELAGLPPRDRVFELMMRRLDALAPFRPGLRRLAADARRDPALLMLTACRLDRSLAWLQEAAGLRSQGLCPRLRRRALGAVYVNTLRTWLRDEGGDQAKTMAELDKALRRVEPFAGLRERRGRRARDEEAPEVA
jgi:AcrR family transcriptional regulator